MLNRPKIECDVHDLLDEANVMLLMHVEASPVTDDLIRRLKRCADAARKAGRDDITDRLHRAAELLMSRLHVAGAA